MNYWKHDEGVITGWTHNWYRLGLSTLVSHNPYQRKCVASSVLQGPDEMEWDICLNEYYIFSSSLMLYYWTDCTLENSLYEVHRNWKFNPFGSFFLFPVKRMSVLAWEMQKCVGIPPCWLQHRPIVCRSNRWPWSSVARKLVIKHFNSNWFGNLRFIKSRVRSFVIQMERCLISPSYFSWQIFACPQSWI